MPAPIIFAALLQIADTGPVTRTSTPNDCEIMVLAGKEKLGWGDDLPSHSFAGNRFSQDGTFTYVVNCDWKVLGIFPPEQSLGNDRIRSPAEVFRNSNSLSRTGGSRARPLLTNPNWTSTISPPEYDPSGTRASANVQSSKFQGGVRGVVTQAWTCSFAQNSGKWNLEACMPQPDPQIGVQRIEIR